MRPTRRRVAVLIVLAASLLAGCGATISASTSLANWASANSFGQGVWDLLHDAKDVRVAVAHHDAPIAIRTYCLELFQDANGENTDLLPTPDAQLTRLLSAAYDGFVHAAAVCDERSSSPAALAVVDRDLATSLGSLVEGALREQAVTGRSINVAGIP